ncbi:MAG: phenylpropionate dioxygenase-like ring-hydroxylating dioxygenase large terminal subunit [Hyphomicrobiaceae bacterium]|jgi:phenylpropionate dioxygenase-like ring-hydroxylating dioxygenase large terminal subunit
MARRDVEHTELPIPNGWYAVAWSKELIRGQVQSIRYFSEDLVLFRTREGHARVVDAYCVHLGAHLGEGGSVLGETLKCPFHGWQYEGETGAVSSIPYCERIPTKAKVRAWRVDEKNGMIFVWHHDQGREPSWEVHLLPEIGDAEWSEPRTFELTVPVHVQDMHENNNDPIHFQYVHGSIEPLPTEVVYYDEGRSYRMVSQYERETPLGTFNTELVRDAWGIGLASVRSVGIPDAGLLMFSSSSPVENNLTHSRWLLTCTNNFVDLVGEEFMTGLTTGVMQDMRIWSNKVHRAQPVLCEGDTFLAEFRQWVRQFYSAPA